MSEQYRNPDDADDLMKLHDEHPDNVVVKQLDITHYEKNFKEFVQEIKVGNVLHVRYSQYGTVRKDLCKFLGKYNRNKRGQG